MVLARAHAAAEPAAISPTSSQPESRTKSAQIHGSPMPGPTSLPPDCINLLRPHLALADRVRFASSCRTLRDCEPLQADRAKSSTIQNAHTIISKFASDRAQNIDELEVPFLPTVFARVLFGSKQRNIKPFKELEKNVKQNADDEARVILLCDLAVALETLPERVQADSLQRILASVLRTGAKLPPAAHVDAAERAFRARAIADRFSAHRLLGVLQHVLAAITRLDLESQGAAYERLFLDVPRIRTQGYDFNGSPCIIETTATNMFTDAVRQANEKLPEQLRAQLPPSVSHLEIPGTLGDIIEMLD